MRTIKLMADYGCFPLWEAAPQAVGNIDPDSLPISQSLKDDLLKWAQAYDNTLNLDDPISSGFCSVEEENMFKRFGYELAERLKAELGKGFVVKTKI